MAMRKENVLDILMSDEPDYAEAVRRFGPEILPQLESLITGDDPGLASKATSLAGMIAGRKAATVLRKASQSDDPRVRVAAAAAAQYLTAEQASKVLIPLVQDEDEGVVKTALKSIPPSPHADLISALDAASALRGRDTPIYGLMQRAARQAPGRDTGSEVEGEMPQGRMDEDVEPPAWPPGQPARSGRARLQGEMPQGRMDEDVESPARPPGQPARSGRAQPQGEMPQGPMPEASADEDEDV